MLNMLFDAVGY